MRQNAQGLGYCQDVMADAQQREWEECNNILANGILR